MVTSNSAVTMDQTGNRKQLIAKANEGTVTRNE